MPTRVHHVCRSPQLSRTTLTPFLKTRHHLHHHRVWRPPQTRFRPSAQAVQRANVPIPTLRSRHRSPESHRASLGSQESQGTTKNQRNALEAVRRVQDPTGVYQHRRAPELMPRMLCPALVPRRCKVSLRDVSSNEPGIAGRICKEIPRFV